MSHFRLGCLLLYLKVCIYIYNINININIKIKIKIKIDIKIKILILRSARVQRLSSFFSSNTPPLHPESGQNYFEEENPKAVLKKWIPAVRLSEFLANITPVWDICKFRRVRVDISKCFFWKLDEWWQFCSASFPNKKSHSLFIDKTVQILLYVTWQRFYANWALDRWAVWTVRW